MIGYEFARDNEWRCIDRDDLSGWVDRFSSRDGNIIQKITSVKTEAEAKIKMARPPSPCLKH